MTITHLQAIRTYEISRITSYLKPGMSILEIGTGNGWQAKLLKQAGMNVIPLDITLPDSHGEFVLYNGVHLPVKTRSIDLIFSSNTLEHVDNLDPLQNELHRVLKPTGRAIHFLPTPTWRLWTSVVFYSLKLKRLGRLHPLPHQAEHLTTPGKPLVSRLFPQRHGVVGNFLTESYYFSRTRWSKHLIATGWQIERIYSNKLFYSGYSMMDAHLSISTRYYLSYLLGGSCAIYVLRKAP